jgi:hypothetical protein
VPLWLLRLVGRWWLRAAVWGGWLPCAGAPVVSPFGLRLACLRVGVGGCLLSPSVVACGLLPRRFPALAAGSVRVIGGVGGCCWRAAAWAGARLAGEPVDQLSRGTSRAPRTPRPGRGQHASRTTTPAGGSPTYRNQRGRWAIRGRGPRLSRPLEGRRRAPRIPANAEQGRGAAGPAALRTAGRPDPRTRTTRDHLPSAAGRGTPGGDHLHKPSTPRPQVLTRRPRPVGAAQRPALV